uniref:Uncharacterized protein n=1 Tax=uncultured Desulfobacterium sp. TaxID=201089 RepID=E1YIJ6_9BACT|nr:unknown protein [uncultured Desulfobacterium sp.]
MRLNIVIFFSLSIKSFRGSAKKELLIFIRIIDNMPAALDMFILFLMAFKSLSIYENMKEKRNDN